MKRVLSVLVTLTLCGNAFAQVKKPLPDPLQTEFRKLDALRAAKPADTAEHALAAQKAAALAAQIAWKAFDTGKFDEASTWFARRASLKLDGYKTQRAALLKQSTTLQTRFKTQLATAGSAAEKAQWQGLVDTAQILLLTQLQVLARENNDVPTILSTSRQKLTLTQAQLSAARLKNAPADLYEKTLAVVRALDDVGGAQTDMAAFADAEKAYLQAQAMRRQLPADMVGRDLFESSRNLAGLHSKQGDLAQARHFYEEALQLREADAALRQKAIEKEEPDSPNRILLQINDGFTEVMILNNLGKISSDSGDFKMAQSYYDRSLASLEKLPQQGLASTYVLQMKAVVQANIGALHADQGLLTQAQSEIEAAIKAQRALGAEDSAAVGLGNLSGLLTEKGDYKNAQRFLEQARQLSVTAQDMPKVVTLTLGMAALMNKMERLPEAEKYAVEATLLARKSGDWSLKGQATRTLASVRLSQGQPAKAQTLLLEADEADKKVGAPLDIAYTLELRGRVREGNGDLAGAVELYKTAIALTEGVRATAVSETAFAGQKNSYRLYERLVQALIKLNRGEEAFDYMNRSRSKQLQDALRVDSLKTGNKALQNLLERAGGLEVRTRNFQGQLETEQAKADDQRDPVKIRNLQGAIASTRGEWRRTVEQIKAADPSYEKLFTVKPLVLSETQRSIPNDAAFVMYVPLKAANSEEEKLYIFLVTHESLKIFTPPVKVRDLWTRVRAVRRQIALRQDDAFSRGIKANSLTSVAVRGPGEAPAPAPTNANEPALSDNLVALYDMLVKPIEPEIASKKLLAFIPTQLLYYLPMQALAKKQGDELRFLIEDKQLVYLTGADVMKVVQDRDGGKSAGGLTAFGNPTGANLPNAEEEVKSIAQIYPASTLFDGAQVTKTSVTDEKNLQQRVVHFATHGVLSPTVPAHSYILLSPGKAAGDEQLTVGEVWDLPLQKVDLVVLSACDTAIGEREPNGTELTTLAEAFSSAGATSVMASLWSVADESTKDLMVEFYRQLAAGQSKAVALQNAELSVMRNPKYRHPYFWAPFVLMGDWR